MTVTAGEALRLPGVEVTLCLDEGRVVGLVVSGKISTRALRPIRLRELERYAIAQLRHSAAGARERAYLGLAAEAAVAGTFERATTVPPKASRERYLAGLAARYVDLCAASATPTKTLAEERCMSAATVRDQLAQARYRKLLTHPGAGRAGGELTPKAEALLTEKEA